MKAPNKAEVIDFLQSYISNNKQYIVSGVYEETPTRTVNITVHADSIAEVYEEYTSAFETVLEEVYERESTDPAVREAVASHYTDWEEMDEDERDEAVSVHVIEEYCNSNEIDSRIDLIYHDTHKLIQSIIDKNYLEYVDEDEWTEGEQPEDGLIMIDDKAGMVVGEPELAITHYEIIEGLEAYIVMEYVVDVLINGKVCSYPLYTMEFDLYGEGGRLDWEVCA